MKFFLACFVIITFAGLNAGNAECLSYENPIQLIGKLSREPFPGPPNYADIQAGDKKETYWMLTIQQPVCIDANQNDKLKIDVAVPKISKFELVFNDSIWATVSKIKTTNVVITGNFFGAWSGHHHTKALINVDKIAGAQ